MNAKNNNLGDKIRRERMAHGLNQKEFAKILGVPAGSLCKWERGKITPEFESLFKIIECLGLKPNELLDLVKKDSDAKRSPADFENTDHSSSLEVRVALIVAELSGLTPSEQLVVLSRVESGLKENRQ